MLMSHMVAPDGYLPYRLFNYLDGDCLCVIRPEQFIGLAVSPDSSWTVKVALKDGYLNLDFGEGDHAKARALAFAGKLHAFIEDEALRNTHNAVMRKGKGNA
jgi:hypothetical protein